MSDDLFLRRAMIGGATAPDDYIVIWDDLPIGRIHKVPGVGGHHGWNWSCAVAGVPQRSSQRGRANSLSEAKTIFRRAWEELHDELSHDEIRKAREAANDRSRPWQKRD